MQPTANHDESKFRCTTARGALKCRQPARFTGRLLALLFLLSLVNLPEQLCAHELGQSYIILRIYDDSIEGRFEITVDDLNTALGVDFDPAGGVTSEDVEPHIDAIKSLFATNVKMSAGGQACNIRLNAHRLESLKIAQYVVIEFSIDNLPETPQYLDVDYSVLFDDEPEHRGVLAIEHNWNTGTLTGEPVIALIFGPQDEHQRLDLSTSNVMRGFVALVKLGTHHIWDGKDHILFLLALLLPAVVVWRENKWEPVAEFRAAVIQVVKIVTVFTIAHSLTLSLAALNVVQLPARLVESIIAISIACAAAGVFRPVLVRSVWWVVFAFGLFHGFGFASILSSMGIPSTYMVLSLLGFNLGVEIGQVAIVCVVFPLLFAVRRSNFYTSYVLKLGALLLILVSLYWFVERAFDVDLPAGEFTWWLLSFFK